MRDADALSSTLLGLEGKPYGGYRALAGEWRFDGFTLRIDRVQADPFAAPSRVRLEFPPTEVGLTEPLLRSTARRVAVASCLARALGKEAEAASATTGSGRGGRIEVASPGQEVLPQTAVQVRPDGSLEARIGVGLPARGRRILGEEARRILLSTVPMVARRSLAAGAHDPSVLLQHAVTNEDAEHLRALLPSLGLVAFVADGSVLPRRSGVDPRPLTDPSVVPFHAPPTLRVEVDLPNRGRVRGMGVPTGVTLIVGGGFHGKSTLLQALQAGVVNHRPGDGRELVVTVSDAVKIRAEEGRAVAGVDISPFIDGLPPGHDTGSFTTPNASGSTSQAAALMEALEAGSRTLLFDEDSCATNFMIRDRRMQALVPRESEPITPLVDRIRELFHAAGVSSVLVLGGSGDYLDVADTVLGLRDYVTRDVTERAQSVAAAAPTGRSSEASGPFRLPPARRPEPGSLVPARGRRAVSIRVPDGRTLLFGEERVDVAALEQLVDPGQLRAIGAALATAAPEVDRGTPTITDILDAIERAVQSGGLDALAPYHPGDFTAFRRYELAAVLNRIRSLRVSS